MTQLLENESARLQSGLDPTKMIWWDSDDAFDYAQGEVLREDWTQLLNNASLVMIVSSLEQEIHRYCHVLASAQNQELRAEQLRGSLMERFRTVVLDILRVPLSVNPAQWQDIKTLIVIRNLIIHASGELVSTTRTDQISQFSKHYPTLSIRDSRIYPSLKFCGQMIKLERDFLTSLWETAINFYSTKPGSK